MTIAGRNKLFYISIFITAFLTVAAGAALFIIISKSHISNMPSPDTTPFFYSSYSGLVSIISIFMFPLSSLLISGYMFFLFKKIHALEISLFMFFVFLLGFEGLRLCTPLFTLWEYNPLMLTMLSRLLLFFRILAMLVLLASSLFATQIVIHRPVIISFLMGFTAFLIASEAPINTTQMSVSFIFLPGFISELVTGGIFFMACSVLSYLLAGKTKQSKEYQRAGFSLAFALGGYVLLFLAPSAIFLTMGVLLFLSGTFFFIKSIYHFYLWQ